MPKVGFISLGCPKNLVDSEVMMGILSREGYELTPRADDAEILVVNTCSFIEPAQKESVDAILEMAEHKKFGSAKKLIVAGCLVERYRSEILEQVPEVDAVVGTGEVERILEAVEGDLKVLPAQPPSFLYHDLTPRIVTTPRHQAYIKIAEGCDHPCSFCIIPQLRGAFRSRRFESVVREAENLAAAGTREITLIGQDTTSYGEDLGLRDGLPLVLEKLAAVEGLLWVRFLYAYPNRVTQKLLDTLAAHPRLAKYLDMPLQHASRNVLARMKRGSNGDAFLKLLERIRITIPEISLRTSFIVGFPGETEAEFAETLQLIDTVGYAQAFSFKYSPRPGTPAATMVDQVPLAVMDERLQRLQDALNRDQLAFNQASVGKHCTVLVERKGKLPGQMLGKSPWLQSTIVASDAEIGALLEVEITAGAPNSVSAVERIH